jgi:YesN/AraC family two-component response regulator
MTRNNIRLLIVNDEKLTAETMCSDIEWSKYGVDSVQVSFDAQMAKDIIITQTIDLLLCDIEMPGESGLGLLAWVRENSYDIECIFLTCHANFHYAKEAITLDCQDYILIPAMYEDIGKTVKKVAERIRVNRENIELSEYGRVFLRGKMRDSEFSAKLKPEELMGKVKAYIVENLSDPSLCVKSIAEYFFFHPVYLNRLFRKYSDMSVGQCIIKERIKLACHILLNSEMSINEISLTCGYRYYSGFKSIFKKTIGCLPSQYREKHLDDSKRH